MGFGSVLKQIREDNKARAVYKSRSIKFADWIDEEEREKVREGYLAALDYYSKEGGIGSPKLRRIVDNTEFYLYYIGDQDPRHLGHLEGLERFWRQRGEDVIADALDVRIIEAMYDEPDPTETVGYLGIEEDSPKDKDEEEESAETLRSLVAKLLRYTKIFEKTAKRK